MIPEITRYNLIRGAHNDAVSTLGLESVSSAKKSGGPNFDLKLPGSATRLSDGIETTGFIEEENAMYNIVTWKYPNTVDTKATIVQTLFSDVTYDMFVLTLGRSEESGVSQDLRIIVPWMYRFLDSKNVFQTSNNKEKDLYLHP